MSSSILPHMIFSIFLLISIPSAVSSPSLLKQACKGASPDIDTDLCLQILQSEPKIEAATNMLELSIAIMETGISNATSTYSYIESKLKDANLEPDFKGALQECNLSYIWAIGSLNNALGEVKDIKEYQTATYDLAMETYDGIKPCKEALLAAKIEDEVILNGNKALEIFGLSANIVVAMNNNTDHAGDHGRQLQTCSAHIDT